MLEPYYCTAEGVDLVGWIPLFLSERDPRSAVEQLDASYQHGGGWRPLQGWSMDPSSHVIRYPGDPSLQPVAKLRLHDSEIICVYRHGWVAVVQMDDSFQIARMD